ncbi:TPA: septation ring formation regulator EzrA [Enterococcus faecalis]|uniref:septation ring formation regulator EzrA n=1 Tax=Enterococcus TaxID=1350 RepID=UPI0001B2BA4C|nr:MULTISPECIES: septation ring formation regulator EzrA [Enterococcus]ETJ09150.1 MAG: Septation ring formation regulator EzrA [Enterococcus faecalis DORA_14]HAP3746656.1 septation ring formation regulator EzrA [Enterococcus faecalis TDR28]HAP3752638.1 septation ring formation regulator EzrA [Enterococcus faecalis TDR22]HAP3755414.1 septation ring formation regulator EzrA [Enterococcus faecalis TDR13]HAP3758493.1 septation ring formation regulator EzrA [Enterococcus faecalis TDR7]HAP3769831.1
MKNNWIIILVLVIVIIAAVLYLIGYFMRKKNQEQLDELEVRKEALFDLPVFEEIDDIKKMHLVGQSQNSFREWNQRWVELSTRSFAELESQIYEVENQNEIFRFMKAKKAVVEANETMTEMEAEVEVIRNGLKELRESEERNSLEVQKALDVYEELSKSLKDDKASFGPAYSEIQKQLRNVEIEFTQFVTLNTSGDPIEAREVLEDAERHTYELEDLMKRIPPMYEELNETFPDQLKEIEEGYNQLLVDDYVFPEQNFAEEIQHAKKRVENSMADLEKTEIAAVEVANRDTATAIDALYEVMEREIEAKKYVVTNQKIIDDYISHSLKNNRQLMIELDHVSQSYTLNNNELGRSRGFQTEIEEIIRRQKDLEPRMKEHTVPYSEIQAFYKECYKILDDIENQQLEIDASLKELRKGEKVAQEKVDEYEFRLRSIKRYVEKQRLPGLSADYLEFFYVATDRIEDLSRALNKMRINMDEINRLCDLCEDDLELLDKKTKDLVNAAALTEQMMQYANRYRHTHENIRAALDKSMYLFSTEFRYQDALDEIGTALEAVEPGAFKRIEDFYFKNINNPNLTAI